MIPKISFSSINFKSNDISSVRDAYHKELDENNQIAQGQNNIIASNGQNPTQLKNQISMQGGQKLDVIA